MTSAALSHPEIIVGRVLHRRNGPAAHQLSYPMFLLWIPMSKLASLPGLGLAINGGGWISYNDRDHGARDGTPAADWIARLLSAYRIDADGEIELVCLPRMLGYAFKPVSFWICRKADGAVRAVVAEVHNTFGEAHSYVLANGDGSPLRDGQVITARKTFHVSPFLEVKGTYAFRFSFGPGRFAAHIDYTDDSGTVLKTSVAGRTSALTRSSVTRAALRFPLQAVATTLRIHWNALLLWLKAAPFFTKPEQSNERASR